MGAMMGSASWGDYDNDGDPDIVISGKSEDANDDAPVTIIYRNDDGSFTDIEAGLTGVEKGAAAWGDYDSDGDLDLALSGDNPAGQDTARIYKNEGSDTFVPIGAYIDGAENAALDWGDIDNDGDLDLAMIGRTDAFNIIFETLIYRNDGSDTFTQLDAGLDSVEDGSIYFGDYDADNDQDLLYTGKYEAWIYENDGSGNFTGIEDQPGGMNVSDASWGDYDDDGDLDFAIAGETSGLDPNAAVYEQTAPGTFDFALASPLEKVENCAVEWVYADDDEHLDLLLAGYNESSDPVTNLYLGDGNGGFTPVEINIPGFTFCDADWADFDGDGNQDLLISGRDEDFVRRTVVYEKTGDIATSIPEIGSSNVYLQAGPNPADDVVFINYALPSAATQAELTLTDAAGRVLKSYPLQQGLPEGQQRIDTSALPNGVVFYSIVVDGKSVDTRKLVLSR